ncbi:hypothetical protein AWB69_03898 [Caballeronia udeis]|uniref:Uncharacterized protein n=1 Tax=Caballeronia udeis TaxID=1232866 RepID=A0A158H4W7_9BURK|nr:hypothetical protein [Caballeronia udeis]SAL39378.1 hypothetical protein AWB69_03898 [Caballeronia udeis]
MTHKQALPRIASAFNSMLRPALITCVIAGSAYAKALNANAQTAPAQQPFPAQALPPGHPGVQQPSPQSLAAEGVRTSANIARGAADICNIDRKKIDRFKVLTRKNFPAAPDFDGEWNLGYKEAQSTVDRFAAMKTNNPTEYAKEIGEACPALTQGIDDLTK